MDPNGFEVTKQRILKNEQAFEAYNDRRIEFERGGVDPETERVPIVCECGNPDCIMSLELTPAAYADVHRDPQRFIVRPGHVFPEVERVVDRFDGYWVLEKLS